MNIQFVEANKNYAVITVQFPARSDKLPAYVVKMLFSYNSPIAAIIYENAQVSDVILNPVTYSKTSNRHRDAFFKDNAVNIKDAVQSSSKELMDLLNGK